MQERSGRCVRSDRVHYDGVRVRRNCIARPPRNRAGVVGRVRREVGSRPEPVLSAAGGGAVCYSATACCSKATSAAASDEPTQGNKDVAERIDAILTELRHAIEPETWVADPPGQRGGDDNVGRSGREAMACSCNDLTTGAFLKRVRSSGIAAVRRTIRPCSLVVHQAKEDSSYLSAVIISCAAFCTLKRSSIRCATPSDFVRASS